MKTHPFGLRMDLLMRTRLGPNRRQIHGIDESRQWSKETEDARFVDVAVDAWKGGRHDVAKRPHTTLEDTGHAFGHFQREVCIMP